MPGGICLSTVCEMEVICAVAVRISTSGRKKIFTTPMPLRLWLSICSISLTEVESWRS